ncbi:TLD-domain containing nucleolar protein [Euphorbia peplus]|nr:TLD-domain containing nucleolar protein [Euphorbia peplus]
MGKARLLKNKAVHFVSDLTTVFLNPISDHPSNPPGDHNDSGKKQLESITDEDRDNLADGPDTSSFTAFLYSFLSSEGDHPQRHDAAEIVNQPSDDVRKESTAKKGFLSRGRQSLRTIYQAARIGGSRGQERRRGDSDVRITDESDHTSNVLELKDMNKAREEADIPAASEPSLLLSEKARSSLYASLPALVQGRKWLLLYSTWRHGISLSTLYRRSMLWPGLSLLVVGDKKGAVFGGLVEAPLRPNNKRYQGTNNTFVFTDIPGRHEIFRPTGANRYFTLCSPDFLAIGGGGHFALYLDGDLLNGSSSVSETYGNRCLAHSEDFQVKEVELWGFVYGSKYEEILALSRREAPGICRW